MNIQSLAPSGIGGASAPLSQPVALPRTRNGQPGDGAAIAQLVRPFVEKRLMLPRTAEQIERGIENYVVAVTSDGGIVACAALDEYSPSLAEVSSVAVAPDHQGCGLGSLVVLAVERLARARGVAELFAMSLTSGFFRALGYDETSVSRYPEKLMRYEVLTKAGVVIVPKQCFRKVLEPRWTKPRIMGGAAAASG